MADAEINIMNANRTGSVTNIGVHKLIAYHL